MPGRRDGRGDPVARPTGGVLHAWYTPWLILVASLAIVFSVYGVSLAWRDHDLSRRGQDCAEETAAALRRDVPHGADGFPSAASSLPASPT